MTHKQNALAVLNYEKYDALPVVHFGFWTETLEKWVAEGHLRPDEPPFGSNPIAKKLGFDFGWEPQFCCESFLYPKFERKVIETLPDGSRKVRNADGVIELEKDEAGSIPMEFDHLLKDRESWEEHYKPRLLYCADRTLKAQVAGEKGIEWHNATDLDPAEIAKRDDPQILYVGSLMGKIRDTLGVQGLSYLYADDDELYEEIIETTNSLVFQCLENALSSGIRFDAALFWEDICFKTGPLVIPSVYDELCGPWYKKISGLLNQHGVNIVSLDCDGLIDSLIPTWVENGVNTMFPIEVGTWHAEIAPWRKKYGRELRGVGGMNKNIFARDVAAIDAEIERLRPLIDLGGYIPCPDHRIPPDAKWDLVRYYCDQMHKKICK